VQTIDTMKDDIKTGSKLDLEKVEFAISREVENQTKPLRSEIKDVVSVQISALDEHQKSMAEKLTTIDFTQSADQVKMAQIQDMFNSHVTLMDALNQKSDA